MSKEFEQLFYHTENLIFLNIKICSTLVKPQKNANFQRSNNRPSKTFTSQMPRPWYCYATQHRWIKVGIQIAFNWHKDILLYMGEPSNIWPSSDFCRRIRGAHFWVLGGRYRRLSSLLLALKELLTWVGNKNWKENKTGPVGPWRGNAARPTHCFYLIEIHLDI